MTNSVQFFLDKLPGEPGSQGRVFFLNNPDGTIRWIWPADLGRPEFLRFYNAGSFKARLFAMLIRMVFFLRMQRFFFSTAEALVPSCYGGKWALFTGTNGLSRKMVVYAENRFVKIPLGQWAAKALQNEASALDLLSRSNMQTFGHPQLLQSHPTFYEQSEVEGAVRTVVLPPAHLAIVSEIFEMNKAVGPYTGSDLDITTDQNLGRLAASSRMPHGLLKKLQHLQLSLHGLQRVETGAAHGDFTPWNMVQDTDGRFFVYDWESFSYGNPKGFDAFHFIMQQAILVDRKPWKVIYNTLESQLTGVNGLFATKEEMETYLKLYLLVHIPACMMQYTGMQHWHTQIYWMIDIWNAALDNLKTPMLDDRQQLILSLTDHLTQYQYAGIKIPHSAPETWSSASDIDLITYRKTIASLMDFCQAHPRVARMDIRGRSYMTGIFLWMEDGGTLALDLIRTLKRKSVVFMDAGSIIAGATPNHHGVKIASDSDHARYIAWFYGLNHSAVPQKYSHYAVHISRSKDSADRLLSSILTGDAAAHGQLNYILTESPQNQGFKKIINTITYLADTVRDFLRFDGMMITFSGVDGAGKSTIIDEITTRIQKSLRKEVVVLRHRPSVLPIISALKHGKARAEEISVSKLPRTGTNQSTFSSLVRFGYYYADYFFGQFYIYLKYVCRGKVVLYDRYYFDFINDSKRSNIVLPSGLVKLGYKLLIKPDLNYFLYADPEVILSRKQELDTETIQTLTKKYKALFAEFGNRYSGSRYIMVNNVVKEETLNNLLIEIKAKLTAA